MGARNCREITDAVPIVDAIAVNYDGSVVIVCSVYFLLLIIFLPIDRKTHRR